MNYYRRYIGNYLKKTARLSMLEHGAYSVMLDYYYAEEQPLPLDRQELYTMVRAMTPADRKAVDKIIALYFEAHDDGYHNARADEEIEKAQPAIQASRENGGKGGRPRRNPKQNPVGYDIEEPDGLDEKEPDGLQETEPTGVHPPTTNLQPSSPSLQPPSDEKAKAGKPAINGFRDKAREILDFLNEKTGRHYRPVDANIKPIVARLKEGATPDDMRAVIARKCRQWQGNEHMDEFLRPKTLFGATNYANYEGELK